MLVLSNIIIGIGLLIMGCGMIAFVRWSGFYHRLLYASLVDTIGLIVLLIGVSLRQGSVFAALKILFLVFCVFLTSPIISHKLGRSAYKSLHRGEVKEINE